MSIAGPVELVILDLVKYEIQRLARAGKGISAKIAKLALVTIAHLRTVEASLGPREVDLSLVIWSLTTRNRVVLASADKELLEMCSKNGVPWLRPRDRSGIITSWKDG